MSIVHDLVITGTNCITAVGGNIESTADSVFSGFVGHGFDEATDDQNRKANRAAVIDGFGSRDQSEAEFMTQIADRCLSELCDRYFADTPVVEDLFFFLGLPSNQRPGPAVTEWKETWTRFIECKLGRYAGHVYSFFFPTGNAAGIHGVMNAALILKNHPNAVCITGGIDSLLSIETLSWLEKDWRLVSEPQGRLQGITPSQAAGFFIIETGKGAEQRKKQPLARIISHSVAEEPAPFVSDSPCNGTGLTQAIRESLSKKSLKPSQIDSIFCDINGEHHRTKEWGLADVRCFTDSSPVLIHPAHFMGDVGAAWMPVLTGIATEGFARNTVGGNVMIFCADDHGERGVMIVQKP